MATTRIRAEDIVGITVAVMTHVALLAWLVLHKEPPPPPPVKTVTVTLQGPIADQAGSPSREEAAAAVAPQMGEEIVPPAPVVPAKPEPPRAAPPPPAPQARPVPPRPAPQRIQPAPPRPQPKAVTPAPTRPQPVAPPQRAAPSPKPAPSPARPSRIGEDFLPSQPAGATDGQRRPAGASRIGNNFLPGAPSGSGKAKTPPGPAITPQIRSSLASEVARQLKPRWQAPSGLDVELLATTVEWDLNPDGSLAGPPRVISQSGVNSANRAQADRHKEQALRAVRLASPFQLPPHLFAGWQHLRFTFDRKLSQ